MSVAQRKWAKGEVLDLVRQALDVYMEQMENGDVAADPIRARETALASIEETLDAQGSAS